MQAELKKFFEKRDWDYEDITNEAELKIIYNLYIHNDTDFNKDDLTPLGLNYVGKYHHYITKNYEEMEKYYLKALESGNTKAMFNLGLYHDIITHNYEEMEKYYLMAIEGGNIKAMNNLGLYHLDITKDYEKMEKYYLMAIEGGHKKAMNNFGLYHYEITKNYEKMEKYYLMAIKRGNTKAMNNLGYYHQQITKNYEEMEKYYLMAIESGNTMTMRSYKEYLNTSKADEIINTILKLRKELRETKSENEELKEEITHLKYRPGGPGMEEAQEEFQSLCQTQTGLKE